MKGYSYQETSTNIMENIHCILFRVLFFFIFVISFFISNVKSSETFTNPVDLTWYFENNTIYWVGVKPFGFTKMLAGIMNDKFWLAMNEFCAGEHGGTHMDAPYHFNKNGIKLGQIPVKNLIVQGIIIDISAEVEKLGPDTTLQPNHIENWEKEHGSIPENALVLIKFGWSKYYTNKEKYLGPEQKNAKLKFPGLSREAAQLLVDTKQIVGVGVDTASVDPGFSASFDAHQILNGHGLYLLENVKLLEKLPARDFTLIALPMNIAEGTGAPLRLVAVPHGYL